MTMQKTKMNRGWLIKRLILPAIGLLALGIWGLVDATLIYPQSGRMFSSKMLLEYFRLADESRRLTQSTVKVDDPAAELNRLTERHGAGGSTLTAVERARLEWLKSLKNAWKLEQEEIWVADVKRPLVSATGEPVYAGVGGVSDVKHEMVALHYRPREAEGVLIGPDKSRQTIPVDGVGRYLNEYWAGIKKEPTPLSLYDLPLQWIFTVVGFGGMLYMIALYMRVAAKKYEYDPETHTLVLPGGDQITPADLAEVDKRNWHKYYVTLHIKDRPSRTLDLMRYDGLEDWVLELERIAFPEAAAAEPAETEDTGPDELAAPKDVGRVAAMTYGGIMDGSFAAFLFDAAALRAAGVSPAAYAQGEVLKALSVALRDDGGWRQWLTAACGYISNKEASTFADWLGGRDGTYKATSTHMEPAVAELVKMQGDMPGEHYVIIVGRLSDAVAAKTNEVLMDPPPPGYEAFVALRVHPPTIERVQQPLNLEPGMEIKGDALVGAWVLSREDTETAGLKVEAGV